MAKYTYFWEQLLKQFKSEFKTDDLHVQSTFSSDLDKIGNRGSSGYTGFVEVFAMSIWKNSNSQVFRDLKTVLESDKDFLNLIKGHLEIRVSPDNRVRFNYEPFSWDMMINRYRNYQDKYQMKDEIYKWELVKSFQTRWEEYQSGDLSFVDFFNGINWGNLAYQYTVTTWKEVLQKYPADLENEFLEFIDESKPLQQRLTTFRDRIISMFSKFKEDYKNKHHQEERAYSTILTFVYPWKYTFYMDSFYKKLVKCLDRKPKPAREKLIDYYEIVNDFKDNVLPQYPNPVSVKNHLTENEKYYNDPQNLILIQDIFWVTLAKGFEDKSQQEEQAEESIYRKVVSKLGPEEFEFTLETIRSLVKHFNIKPDQENVAFTVDPAKTSLRFIINNRVLFGIYGRKKDKGFMAMGSKKFKGVTKTEDFRDPNEDKSPVLNYALNKEQVEVNMIDIKSSAALELKKGYKSPKREHSNEEFIEDIYKDLEMKDANRPPLNQILYGPPGTGKTYYLQKEYFPKFTSTENSISKDQFITQIVQNLSWWQVLGIALIEKNNSSVSDLLESNWVSKKAELSESKNVRATVWGTLQMHTINESETVKYTQRQAPLIFDKNADKSWQIFEEEVKDSAPELYEHIDSVVNFKSIPDKKIKRYEFITFHQSYTYEDFVEGIKPVMADDLVDEGGLNYEIKSGVFKDICKRAESDPENDYALFIDEINRGNVSQIFGELITLIEEDKRKGSVNEITLVLPYSRKDFSVPKNLHIIGTMNTADRSVEALDSALRRRFSFRQMPSNPELLSPGYCYVRLLWKYFDVDWDDEKFKTPEDQLFNFMGATKWVQDKRKDLWDKMEKENRNDKKQSQYFPSDKFEGFNLSILLFTINKRIEKLLDNDHEIGHSYFIDVISEEDLRVVFRDKVIPLLQEYFFGDYGKIGLILGQSFIQSDHETFNGFAEFDYENKADLAERQVYRISDPEEWDFQAILNS